MNARTLAAALAAMIAVGFSAIAEQPEIKRLSIDEAVNLAMENNIQLASTAIDVRMKKRAADLAWNVFIPTVQGTGTLARSNSAANPYASLLAMIIPGYTESEPEEKDHWTAMGNLSISLNLNLALFEGLKATRQSYDAGMLTWEQARAQTEQNVRKAFYGLLLQQGSLGLARDKLAISEERMRQTLTNFRNGLVPELSYLQTQLAVETQKPSIMEAELALEQQTNLFAFILGLPLGTKLELDGKIDPQVQSFDADALVRDHLAERYDLAILRQNIDLMETQIRATKLQIYTPSLALSQSYGPRLSAIDAEWLDTENWSDSSGAFSATLAFNITNLLPFSSTQQKLRETKDAKNKLELTMQQAVYNAELEVRNLVKKLEKSRTSIAAMEMNVAIAEKAWRLTEQGYKAGTIEYLDLKDAENTLIQARMGVLSEKFTYLSNLLDLETALNAELN